MQKCMFSVQTNAKVCACRGLRTPLAAKVGIGTTHLTPHTNKVSWQQAGSQLRKVALSTKHSPHAGLWLLFTRWPRSLLVDLSLISAWPHKNQAGDPMGSLSGHDSVWYHQFAPVKQRGLSLSSVWSCGAVTRCVKTPSLKKGRQNQGNLKRNLGI